MKNKILKTIFFLIIFTVAGKTQALAKPQIQVTGWIPYWRIASGTAEATANIKTFSEISPFGYIVKSDGTLLDRANLATSSWQDLFTLAKQNKIKILPTVMWSNSEQIDTVLRDPKKRAAHVKAIISMVKENNFDGVDIDYEGKDSKTKKYFSQFLKELWSGIGKKIVSCTIEARTPIESRFDTPPKDILYANDYTAINKYCDRVRIMTYDQGTVDLRLNETASDVYTPVADPKWVEKVLKLAMKNISANKIEIGVATYGYEYTVTPVGSGYIYDRETSVAQNFALGIASAYGINPSRTRAGELSFSYVPTSTTLVSQKLLSAMAASSATSTPSLDTSQAAANLLSSSLGTASTSTVVGKPFRYITWSDAKAIEDKIALAKKLKVRGIAVFKIDGGADPKIWDILK